MSRIATWSLIQFLCILGGILAAQSIFALYGQPYLTRQDSPVKAVEGLLMLAMSFLLMAMY